MKRYFYFTRQMALTNRGSLVARYAINLHPKLLCDIGHPIIIKPCLRLRTHDMHTMRKKFYILAVRLSDLSVAALML